jgi:hypothetical protein
VSKIVLTTVAEALGAAAAKILSIDAGEIGAEYRVAMTSGGRTGQEVEIYLYDLTPGGAGFVRAAVGDTAGLFKEALQKLESCTCTHSCYECLRSYKNKFDHGHLHRHLGAAFLRHVVLGEAPTISAEEESHLLCALATDLRESGYQVVEEPGALRLPGLENRHLVLGHPLTPGEPGTVLGRAAALLGPTVVIDQLRVDRALPAAVKEATSAGPTRAKSQVLPDFLPPKEGGHPVFISDDLAEAAEGAIPLALVAIEGAPEGAFVVQLTRPTLERMPNGNFPAGAWVVFTKTGPTDFPNEAADQSPRLILSTDGAFNATNSRWTFGLPRVRDDKVHVLYVSHVAPRSESPRLASVRVIGRAYGVFVNGVLRRL